MNFKMKKVGLLFVLLLANIYICGSIDVSADIGTLPNGAVYSWEETQYYVEKTTVWNSVNQVINYSNEYSYDISYTSSYNDTADTYIVKTVNTHRDSNSTVFQNLTFSGNQTVKADLNVYRVDVSYGDGLKLIWMATKDGSWEIDYWITEYDVFTNSTMGDHDVSTITYKQYNLTTDKLIANWTEYEEKWKEYTYCSDDYPTMYNYDNVLANTNLEFNFSAPLIMTIQIYTAPNGEKIAWADMFYDYIIYNDTNADGIYSAGLSENPIPGMEFSIHNPSSDEWCGTYLPMVSEMRMIYAVYNLTDPSKNIISDQSATLFKDKTIDSLSSTIEFNAPTVNTGNHLSWDITYPDYPMYGYFYNRSLGYAPFIGLGDGLYEHSSPGDYSFGFDYKINQHNTDLDYTIDLAKFSNDTHHDMVQGMGLAMPHYTYFMSSYEVEQLTNNDFSMPMDIFDFSIGTTPIAKIDMLNPVKKNYTLHDYPVVGVNSEFESQGATVNELVIQSSQSLSASMMTMTLAPFIGMIFTLEEYVEDDPEFQDFDKLFSIETVNYPIWSGERITHDPTLTAYYITNLDVGGFPFFYIVLITGAFLGVIISVAMARTYRTYSFQKQEKEKIKKTLTSLSSKGKRALGEHKGKISDIFGNLDSEIIDSIRLLNLLENNNIYDLVGKIYIYLTAEDFWNKLSELELDSEDEIQFIRDMLLLTSAERQKIIHNMLKLKDLDHKKLSKNVDFSSIKAAEKTPLIKRKIDKKGFIDRISEEMDATNLKDLMNEENAFELIDSLNLTLTEKDFWQKIKELELNAEDERYFIQDMLSLTPMERQKILDEMLKLKYSNNNDTFL